MQLLNVKGKLIQNQQTIANSFKDYFLTIAEKLRGAIQIDKLSQMKNIAPIYYIFKIVGIPIPILHLGTHHMKRQKGL